MREANIGKQIVEKILVGRTSSVAYMQVYFRYVNFKQLYTIIHFFRNVLFSRTVNAKIFTN